MKEMSDIREKWNTKWKGHRMQLLFSNFSTEERSFFSDLYIWDVYQTNYTNDYKDGSTIFDLIIEVIYEDDMYYICKEEEGERFRISPDTDLFHKLKNTKSWYDFFHTDRGKSTIEDEDDYVRFKKIKEYDRRIDQFVNSFPFSEMLQEILHKKAKAKEAADTKTFRNAVCTGIEYNESDQYYYMVFDNGESIPYKKEDSQTIQLEF